MNKGYGNVIKGLEMGDYTGLAEWALNASYKGPLSERGRGRLQTEEEKAT